MRKTIWAIFWCAAVLAVGGVAFLGVEAYNADKEATEIIEADYGKKIEDSYDKLIDELNEKIKGLQDALDDEIKKLTDSLGDHGANAGELEARIQALEDVKYTLNNTTGTLAAKLNELNNATIALSAHVDNLAGDTQYSLQVRWEQAIADALNDLAADGALSALQTKLHNDWNADINKSVANALAAALEMLEYEENEYATLAAALQAKWETDITVSIQETLDIVIQEFNLGDNDEYTLATALAAAWTADIEKSIADTLTDLNLTKTLGDLETKLATNWKADIKTSFDNALTEALTKFNLSGDTYKTLSAALEKAWNDDIDASISAALTQAIGSTPLATQLTDLSSTLTTNLTNTLTAAWETDIAESIADELAAALTMLGFEEDGDEYDTLTEALQAAWTNDIDELETELKSYVDTEIGKLNSAEALPTLQAALKAAWEADIATLSGNVKTAYEKYTNNAITALDLTNKLSTLSSTLTSAYEDAIIALSAENGAIYALSGTVDGINTTVGQLQTAITGLTAEGGAVTQAIAALTADGGDVTKAIAALTADGGDVTKAIAAAQESITTEIGTAISTFKDSDDLKGVINGVIKTSIGSTAADTIGKAISDALATSIGSSESGTIGKAIADALATSIGGSADGTIGKAITDAINDAIGETGSITGAISTAISTALSSSIGGSADGTIGKAITDAVGGLQTTVANDISSAVGTLNETITTEVGKINTAIGNIDTSIETIRADITALQNEDAKLWEQVIALQKDIIDLAVLNVSIPATTVGDFKLPAKIGNVTITWSLDDSDKDATDWLDITATSGTAHVLQLPSVGARNVALYAIFSYGVSVSHRNYIVQIKAPEKEDLQSVLDALGDLIPKAASHSFKLPLSVVGKDIEWTIQEAEGHENEQVADLDTDTGWVTVRPNAAIGDDVESYYNYVTLTAKLAGKDNEEPLTAKFNVHIWAHAGTAALYGKGEGAIFDGEALADNAAELPGSESETAAILKTDNGSAVKTNSDGTVSLTPSVNTVGDYYDGPYFAPQTFIAEEADFAGDLFRGYTVSGAVYVDPREGGDIIAVFGVNGRDGNQRAEARIELTPNPGGSTSEVTYRFDKMTGWPLGDVDAGWYTVGVHFYEYKGKLAAQMFLVDDMNRPLFVIDAKDDDYSGYGSAALTVPIGEAGGPRALRFLFSNQTDSVRLCEVAFAYDVPTQEQAEAALKAMVPANVSRGNVFGLPSKLYGNDITWCTPYELADNKYSSDYVTIEDNSICRIYQPMSGSGETTLVLKATFADNVYDPIEVKPVHKMATDAFNALFDENTTVQRITFENGNVLPDGAQAFSTEAISGTPCGSVTANGDGTLSLAMAPGYFAYGPHFDTADLMEYYSQEAENTEAFVPYTAAVTVYVDPNDNNLLFFRINFLIATNNGMKRVWVELQPPYDGMPGPMSVFTGTGNPTYAEGTASAQLANAGWYTFGVRFDANEEGKLTATWHILDAADASAATSWTNVMNGKNGLDSIAVDDITAPAVIWFGPAMNSGYAAQVQKVAASYNVILEV